MQINYNVTFTKSVTLKKSREASALLFSKNNIKNSILIIFGSYCSNLYTNITMLKHTFSIVSISDPDISEVTNLFLKKFIYHSISELNNSKIKF
jgi:hypothetical protein